MRYFSAHQRLWLVGPLGLLMFWLYCFAVTRQGPLRIIIGVPFMVLNAAFNATCGTIIFAEPPREWFFTDRLKRHRDCSGACGEVARTLCAEMCKADPGHC